MRIDDPLRIADPDGVLAALTDDRLVPPPAPPAPSAPRGLAWLRAYVPRFSSGADHARRRGLVTALLDRLDPAVLRADAAAAARAVLAAGGDAEAVAGTVPVTVLAARLGLTGGSA